MVMRQAPKAPACLSHRLWPWLSPIRHCGRRAAASAHDVMPTPPLEKPMQPHSHQMTRRTALVLAGAAATAAVVAVNTSEGAFAQTLASGQPPSGHDGVSVLVNGSAARVGSYVFPDEADTVTLDNGLVRFTFGRDDAAGGVLTGWTDTSITATSVVVDGTELGHDLNGVDPRDPDRQHSFYVDSGGGKQRLLCSRVEVVRMSDELVEVAFVDTTNTPIQHTHHLVMRRGKPGLYGFVVMSIVADTTLNEIRMNTRWNRGLLDHSYNWERGSGQQPTYAYLAKQLKLGDETWQVAGTNDPSLPWPDSNGGNLPAGTVYSKYNWSLYHHENPMFGHYGSGFGTWLTPLGGVTDKTLCAFYAAGPQHQDLAIHQDALILNYFAPNHYGQTTHSVAAGYTRLFGPWFTFVTCGDQRQPENAIARAAGVAATEIAENRAGASWMDHRLYPSVQSRTTVSGRVTLRDGRAADGLWVLLSTQDSETVFTIKEATYFVRTGADGWFELPGIPPAWAPGSTTPSTYTMYVFSAEGSATQQYKQAGVDIHGRRQDLGTIVWDVAGPSTFLWQIGDASRTGAEFALATKPFIYESPRSYEKPSQVPADLDFSIGHSWEPKDWYYAQTRAGTWTVTFELDRGYAGTGVLTVSTSMQQGGTPTVLVNGVGDGIIGVVPTANDSTLSRQADRSGYPRLATLTLPAQLLQKGTNSIAFTRGASGSGIGWDTVVLEVDESSRPAHARLHAALSAVRGPSNASVWTLTVANTGRGTAYDVRLCGLQSPGGGLNESMPVVLGSDPNEFPVPVAGLLAPGQSVKVDVTLDLRRTRVHSWMDLDFTLSADGGRTLASTRDGRKPKVVQLS
jgi:rhamnogalacturonan endolyase